MGLKELNGFVKQPLSASKLKSDQDGIERGFCSLMLIYDTRLKSDQDGIERI